MLRSLFKSKLLIIVLSAFLAACSSTVSVDESELATYEKMKASLKVGEHVAITTQDGEVHEFIVRSIGEESVKGSLDEIRYDDITAINKEKFSFGKTAQFVGASWLALNALLLAAIFI